MQDQIQEVLALTMRWVPPVEPGEVQYVVYSGPAMLFWLIFLEVSSNVRLMFRSFRPPITMSFLAAGVVVMTVLNNGLAGGVDLLFDKENGFLERLMVTPIRRTSVILSRFLFVMAITGMQILVILGVAFLFDVHPETGILGIGVILLLGMLFGIGLTAISMAMAFSVKSHGDFFSVLGFLSLPMIFLSSALVPLTAMPGWMKALAWLNPMTWVIDAVRPLILTGWGEAIPQIAIAIGVLVVFDALCLYGGASAFRRTVG